VRSLEQRVRLAAGERQNPGMGTSRLIRPLEEDEATVPRPVRRVLAVIGLEQRFVVPGNHSSRPNCPVLGIGEPRRIRRPDRVLIVRGVHRQPAGRVAREIENPDVRRARPDRRVDALKRDPCVVRRELEASDPVGRANLSKPQARSIEPDMVVPFLLYNLDGDERRAMGALFPPVVTGQLVPIVWPLDGSE